MRRQARTSYDSNDVVPLLWWGFFSGLDKFQFNYLSENERVVLREINVFTLRKQ